MRELSFVNYFKRLFSQLLLNEVGNKKRIDIGLRQSDLPEIGSQGVVSEVLSGKRDLNARQIRALSERFGVGPAAFL